jgi:hypothetical protein
MQSAHRKGIIRLNWRKIAIALTTRVDHGIGGGNFADTTVDLGAGGIDSCATPIWSIASNDKEF